MMPSLNNILEVIVLKIENIPCSERPRERLKNVGVENLSNNELFSAICTKFACNAKSKIKIASSTHEVNKLVVELALFKIVGYSWISN